MKDSFFKEAIKNIDLDYRIGGLRRANKTLFSKMYCRLNIFVFKSDLQKIPSPKIQLAFKELFFQDLQDMGDFRGFPIPELIYKERFKDGYKCFGFFLNGKVAHVAWVKNVMNGYLNDGFNIFKINNGIWIYDCFTMPEFRRKGVYSSSLVYLQKILQQSGGEGVFIGVDLGNIFSQKGIKRAGFRYLHTLHCHRIFFFFPFVWKTKMKQ